MVGMHPKSRRMSLQVPAGLGVLAVAAALLVGCSQPAPTPGASGDDEVTLSGQIVWADWGGRSRETHIAVFHDPFMEVTGVDVVPSDRSDAIAFAMLEGGEGDYDVFAAGSEPYSYIGGLAKLPDRQVVDDILPEELRDYGFGSFVFASAQGYLTETYPDGGPQSWADFYDFEKFPGLRAIPGDPGMHDYMFEQALLADGVAPEDLYPLDLERAVKKLDELKGHVIFYTEYPQVQQLLVSDSVAIGVTTHSAYKAIADEGSPTTTVWNQALTDVVTYVIPATAPNLENALALAQTYADPEKQADFAMVTGNGPSSQAAFEFISEAEQDIFPNSPANLPKTIPVDAVWRSENWNLLADTYGKWLATAQE